MMRYPRAAGRGEKQANTRRLHLLWECRYPGGAGLSSGTDEKPKTGSKPRAAAGDKSGTSSLGGGPGDQHVAGGGGGVRDQLWG